MARGEKLHRDPVEAWASIIEDADKAKSFKQARGRGGFVRSSWQGSERADRRFQRVHRENLWP